VIKFTSCLPRVGGFSAGTPASSTTKTGRHDRAEILLKVAFKQRNQKKPLETGMQSQQNAKQSEEIRFKWRHLTDLDFEIELRSNYNLSHYHHPFAM
jgi:hypothetical protein